MMSLAKAVPSSLKDCECKRITLRKCPPVPYVPKKDVVKEIVRLDSRMTRVSRPRLEKVWNYVSPSGTQGLAKLFSCMWDLLWTQSRNKDTSRPTKKPMKPT